MRIEEILPTPADASQSADALSALLGLFRSIQAVQSQLHPGADANSAQNVAIHQFLESIRIRPEKDRTTLTATIPIDLLKQLTAATTDAAAGSH
jgi:hypothetical protein